LGRLLNNFGRALYMEGRFEEAKPMLEESLAISQEIGFRALMVYAHCNLGGVVCAMASYDQAQEHFQAAIKTGMEIQILPAVLLVLSEVAKLWAKTDKTEPALELAAFCLHHPAANGEIRSAAESLQTKLVGCLPPEVAAAAQARGKAKTLENLAAEFLANTSPTLEQQ
jgi:tetratricopeptide (TPR) repeat protein